MREGIAYCVWRERLLFSVDCHSERSEESPLRDSWDYGLGLIGVTSRVTQYRFLTTFGMTMCCYGLCAHAIRNTHLATAQTIWYNHLMSTQPPARPTAKAMSKRRAERRRRTRLLLRQLGSIFFIGIFVLGTIAF